MGRNGNSPMGIICMLDPNVTLNFNLLTLKVDVFVLVPKCTNAESLV